jgi:phosphotransferase system  glucose/maltose/N-acetylglucosamine-specific IIC component
MRFIGRLFVIIFAVIIASLAAGIAIAVGVLGPQWHAIQGDPGERVVFWSLAFVGSVFTGAISILPLAIAIAAAETFKIRSILVNMAAGAVLLLAGYYGSGLARPSYEESIDEPPPPVSREVQLAAASGAVFGFVYWMVAGRNAGRWREGGATA